MKTLWAQQSAGTGQGRDAPPRSHPLVAVVTPVYNAARFLATAMHSVRAQTYRPLLHVVLDNASTDATPAIIQKFQGLDVPVFTKRNASVLPVSRNVRRLRQHRPLLATAAKPAEAEPVSLSALPERNAS